MNLALDRRRVLDVFLIQTKLVAISSDDIVDGKAELTLALVWAIIRHWQVTVFCYFLVTVIFVRGNIHFVTCRSCVLHSTVKLCLLMFVQCS